MPKCIARFCLCLQPKSDPGSILRWISHNISLVLWKHHVSSLLQSIRKLGSLSVLIMHYETPLTSNTTSDLI